MKKKIRILIFVVTLSLGLFQSVEAKSTTVLQGMNVNSIQTTVEKRIGASYYYAKDFEVTSFSTKTGNATFYINNVENAAGAQLRLINPDGKDVYVSGYFNGKSKIYLTIKNKIKPERFYYYQVRSIFRHSNGSEYYGEWISWRAGFSTLTPTITFGKNYTVYIKTPKAHVWYEVFMSTNKNKGYKEIGRLESNQKMKITQFNGKKLKSYGKKKKFYVYLEAVPYSCMGVPTPDLHLIKYFYFK